MQFLPHAALVTLLGSLLPATASAQVRFCLGGNLDNLSTLQRRTCQVQLDQVRRVAANLDLPGDWHLVLVCGEESWSDYAAFSRRGPAELANLSADTDLAQHTTYLRADRLFGANGPANSQLLLAQEVTHMPRTKALAPTIPTEGAVHDAKPLATPAATLQASR